MITTDTIRNQTFNTDNTITIRSYIVTYDDSVEISRSAPSIRTICPGDDYSLEDDTTKKMCKALWSKSLIEAYHQRRTSLEGEGNNE